MSRVVETCGCGARFEGDSSWPSQADRFREAHAGCRDRATAAEAANAAEIIDTAIRETGQAIAEAILAGAEYSEAKEQARELVQELAG